MCGSCRDRNGCDASSEGSDKKYGSNHHLHLHLHLYQCASLIEAPIHVLAHRMAIKLNKVTNEDLPAFLEHDALKTDELWLALSRKRTALRQLELHIDAYIKACNVRAEPVVWTKKSRSRPVQRPPCHSYDFGY